MPLRMPKSAGFSGAPARPVNEIRLKPKRASLTVLRREYVRIVQCEYLAQPAPDVAEPGNGVSQQGRFVAIVTLHRVVAVYLIAVI